MESQYGLLNELLSRKVFSDAEIERVKAERTDTEQNGKILILLMLHNDDQQFEQFKTSLVETGQRHLVITYMTTTGLYK